MAPTMRCLGVRIVLAELLLACISCGTVLRSVCSTAVLAVVTSFNMAGGGGGGTWVNPDLGI